jgi:glycosyltransferase involved in cell wall biosynthesis
MDAADKIVAVSNFTRNIIIQNYHIEPGKIITVYNAVEPVIPEERPKAKKNKGEKTVAFLGRITQQKGPEYFLEVASLVLQKMKNVSFIMAGKGDMLDAMKKRATELNISDHIHFPGFLKDSEVNDLFHMSDVFVMPSVSEPFGIVALEAMQAKVPVIISKQSGASEILKQVIKVDYWDIQYMADTICDLLNNPERCNKLRKQGKKEVDKLLWKNSASKVRDIYFSFPVKPANPRIY